MGIADRIRMARDLMGWSQMRLALEAGIEPSAISRYERGVNEPRANTLAKLARTLGVSADWLLGLGGNDEGI